MRVPAYDPDAPRRVLMVEDETRLREMLLRAVRDMGFEPQGASSGEKAIQMMENQPHELIVLDLNLPGMHGLEFFEIVTKRWPLTQVIILTGFADLEAARKAIQLNVVDFLTKPCTLGELEIALDRAWRRRIQTAEPRKFKLIDVEPTQDDTETSPEQTLQNIERKHILAALEQHNGNRTATAAALGISV